MGRKDHLPTNEEVSRKSGRDIRRAVQTVYIGNPQVITRNLSEAGIVQKTENQVRDTDFPILADIEDLTDNIFTTIVATTKTIQVALGKQEAQFHRLKLDDDTGTITDFVIDFIGLAKNKALEFIADIETIFTGTPTISFEANGTPITVPGLPTAFGDTGTNEFKMLFSAIDTPIIESYEVLNGASGTAAASDEIRDGNTFAIVVDAAPSFAVFLNNIQKFSVSNTRVDYADLDLFGVTSISFEDTVDAVTGTVFTQTQNDFRINLLDNADTFEIDFNSQIGLSVDLLRTRLFSNTPNTVSAGLSLFRDDPSPGVSDALGNINFDGRDSAGNFTTYAQFIGGIQVATSTIEEGSMVLNLITPSGTKQTLEMLPNIFGVNAGSIRLDEISLPSNPTANQGLIYLRDVASVTTPFFLDSAGVETSLIGGGGVSNSISQGDSDITVTDVGSGLIVTTVDGSNVFQIQATRADYQDMDVFGINRLSLRDEAGAEERAAFVAGTSDVTMIFEDANDRFFININSINTATFGPNNLVLNSGAANTTSAALRLFRNDPSPGVSDALGSIHFDGNDDAGNFTNYATWVGGIESAVSGSEIGSMVLNLITALGDKQILDITPTMFAVRDAFIELDELSGTPSNPSANFGLLYLKDNGGGTTTPFFLDSAGVETSLIAGGTDLIPLSNTWTGTTNTFDNNVVLGSSSVDTVTFNADTVGDITPNSNGVDSLGQTAKYWAEVFTERVTFASSGTFTPTAGAAEIFFSPANSSLRINIPTGDNLTVLTNAASNLMVLNVNGLMLTGANQKFSYENGTGGIELLAIGVDAVINAASSSGDILLQIDDVTEYDFGTTEADFNGNDIIQVANFKLDVTNPSPIGGADTGFGANTNGLFYNIPTGDKHIFTVNGSQKFTIDATEADFNNNNLVNVTDIELRAGFNTSKLFFDDGGDTYLTGSGTSGRINVVTDASTIMAFGPNDLELFNGTDISIGTSTGSRIGTTSSDKIGFWGVTPVVRQDVAVTGSVQTQLTALVAALDTIGIINLV